LDDADVDELQRGHLITADGAVRVATEEVDQPTADLVWHIELDKFLQESRMPHRVKRLAEVQGERNQWMSMKRSSSSSLETCYQYA